MKRNCRSHYKVVNNKLIPKKSYETEQEAVTLTRFLNSKENVIHKMIAYKCSKCGKWHIGSNGNLLTDDDREHYRKKLRNK